MATLADPGGELPTRLLLRGRAAAAPLHGGLAAWVLRQPPATSGKNAAATPVIIELAPAPAAEDVPPVDEAPDVPEAIADPAAAELPLAHAPPAPRIEAADAVAPPPPPDLILRPCRRRFRLQR